ncbi:M48 family metalloprotease [Candidatus Peregrinibacteria bacterium]|nr:M48 family metalloprotease [Candidatus Peregrinibacteria bacterium]
MYNAIAANKRRTWILMLLFVGFFLGLGYVYGRATMEGQEGGVSGLTIFGVVAIVYALISYYGSGKLTLALAHAKEANRQEFFHLYNAVENLSIASGLPMPKIYVIDDTAPNAFATGRDPKHAVVAVTTGLLTKLDKSELEGVIAHELSHIQNYDIRLQSIVVALIGLIALLSDIFLRNFLWGRRRSDNDRGNGAFVLIGIALAILSPIIAKLIGLAVSRQREFLADASGAMLTRYPEGLAQALQKISADQEPLEVANQATAHLYFANPFKDQHGMKWLHRLFNTHPPVEDRIKRLQAINI